MGSMARVGMKGGRPVGGGPSFDRPVSPSDWRRLGYRCKTISCTGHNKGWDWGERWGAEDEDYGEGFSESFNEGVQAYVRFQRAALSGEEGEEEE